MSRRSEVVRQIGGSYVWRFSRRVGQRHDLIESDGQLTLLVVSESASERCCLNCDTWGAALDEIDGRGVLWVRFVQGRFDLSVRHDDLARLLSPRKLVARGKPHAHWVIDVRPVVAS